MGWLAKLFSTGKKAAYDLGHLVLNFVKSPAVKDLISTSLGLIAQEVVGQLSTDAFATLTSDQKRQEAFGKITQAAESQGVAFSNSIVSLLIEICVQNLKAHPTA